MGADIASRLREFETGRSAFRASRERTKHLKAYLDAITAYDGAKTAMEEHPEDLKTKETLVKPQMF